MTDTQSCSEWGLHGIRCYHHIGELLPRLSILTGKTLRFISVALSLKSPSPDVIRHPVLCCSDFPHGQKTPRPYNRLKSFFIIPLFMENCTLFCLLFLEKKSKINTILKYIMGESWLSYLTLDFFVEICSIFTYFYANLSFLFLYPRSETFCGKHKK